MLRCVASGDELPYVPVAGAVRNGQRPPKLDPATRVQRSVRLFNLAPGEGRTLASIYSVRPTPLVSVSTPVTWKEVEKGIAIADFRLENVRERIARVGDLWSGLAARKGRFNLRAFV